MEPDFSGWATRYNKKCSDGLTILPGAFKHDDKIQVPLVWRHDDGSPSNILGYATLEHRDEGVYTKAFFNNSEGAKNSRELLRHGDIKSLSIHAREVVKRAQDVVHGAIKEVSLVVAGANPGAVIENVYFKHGDAYEPISDEVIIYSGETIMHGEQMGRLRHEDSNDNEDSGSDNSSDSGETVKDVYDAMSDKQKEVLHYMVGEAIEANDSDDDDSDDDDDDDTTTQSDNSKQLTHGGKDMTKRNVFEHGGNDVVTGEVITHEQVHDIMQDASKVGSLKTVLEHADTYGIQNLELLFPDAKALENTPEWIKRRTEWVSGVMNGTRKTPFSRVKSLHADITSDEARAKGYVKRNQKFEEVFPIMTRDTTPSTIYKKQKMDRDDIIDITDFDVVVWLKAEMRLMLEEELARAILIGDGRAVDDRDKIKDPQGAATGAGIRSILHDSDFYSHQMQVEPTLQGEQLVEQVIRARKHYRGTGTPTFYTTDDVLADLLLARDAEGRRYYNSEAEIASAMRVSSIVPVEVFEEEENLVGIMVNLSDYTIGTDKGGKTDFFDDFDIDFNQYKYLYETRLSGGLTKYKSAIVFRTDESNSGGLPGVDASGPSN